GVLKNIARNTNNYFLFPKDAGVTSGDIGKLMMNDGSGTAKVYQLSPATDPQKGKWVITMEDIGDLSDESEIYIDSVTFSQSFTRVDWRDGATPTTVAEELGLIKDYIDDNAPFNANLTATLVGDVLTIEEIAYDGTQIQFDHFETNEGLYIDTVSRPALPAAPTAFPLGKLIGIDGSNAIISSNLVETYTLEGSLTIPHDKLNFETDLDFLGMEDLWELIEGFLIVPDADGKVKAVNADDFNFDNYFFSTYRHHFLGIAIYTASSSVTVYNLTGISALISMYVRIQRKVTDI
ncbi:MAG TPA: hypothetical protein VK202_08920, partial [Bacteroidia bacterium]|nr:hypothetical protein [Bacteroidia bacterium]